MQGHTSEPDSSHQQQRVRQTAVVPKSIAYSASASMHSRPAARFMGTLDLEANRHTREAHVTHTLHPAPACRARPRHAILRRPEVLGRCPKAESKSSHAPRRITSGAGGYLCSSLPAWTLVRAFPAPIGLPFHPTTPLHSNLALFSPWLQIYSAPHLARGDVGASEGL